MENNPGPAADPAGSHEERLSLEPADLVRSLTPEERTLLIVRNELYEGSWERMETDLRNRLTGKPYIFKLVNRIETDLGIMEFLRSYEDRHGVDLGELVGGE